MPKFSPRSQKVLSELHPLLQQLMREAIKEVDFTLLDAQRGRAEQEKAFRLGNSQAHFGDSAHNYIPAVATDIAPYPLTWNPAQFKKLWKVIGYYDPKGGDGFGIAKRLLIPTRWGGDWDRDGDWKDEHFRDWGHYELDPWRSFAKQGKLIHD